jgi:hypothetical protein
MVESAPDGCVFGQNDRCGDAIPSPLLLHVQQILAGEFGLVGDEGKRASALVPISRSTG